jgi:hypothetical protein
MKHQEERERREQKISKTICLKTEEKSYCVDQPLS